MPVLLISNHPDLDKNNTVEVEREKGAALDKKARKEACLKAIWAAVVLKMKEGPHIQARHQNLTPRVALATDTKIEVPITEGADEKLWIHFVSTVREEYVFG